MVFRSLVGAAAFSCLAAVGAGAEFYAAPNGSANGSGSITSPWTLQTALNQPSAVHPGDTIWLRGGKYSGTFSSHLTGTSASPIVVRQYPGERATLDGGNSSGVAVLTVYGSYAWYWGFEVTSSDPDRSSSQTGSAPSDIGRGEGVTIEQASSHPGLKFINLVVHDTRQGFSFWRQATDSEIAGCLIYYNGWMGADEGHGHGIYAQNDGGIKTIRSNVVFGQFSHGFHAYGSSAAFLNNFDVTGNTLFSNPGRNLLIGGGSVAQNPTVTGNVLYFPVIPTAPSTALRLGYESPCSNLVLTDNYVSNSSDFDCSSMAISGNTFYGYTGGLSHSQFPDNTYMSSRPTGTDVFVVPNPYETGRANITVFDWDGDGSVAVDLSDVLNPGVSYQIRNAQNFFGTPVASGVYAGGAVTIPTSGLTPATPVGWPAPAVTGPEFNVYVLTSTPQPYEFFDVPPSSLFHDDISALAQSGVTSGCGGGNFCPDNLVTRAQMAVLLLKAKHGIAYAPPAATGQVFSDVAASSFGAAWIEQLEAESITTGCGGTRYCPANPVSRAAMAVFLLKTLHGGTYAPPAATGSVFDDVPAGSFAAAWIEQLSAEGITGGCGGGDYCPGSAVKRGQMATFLVRTFSLP